MSQSQNNLLNIWTAAQFSVVTMGPPRHSHHDEELVVPQRPSNLGAQHLAKRTQRNRSLEIVFDPKDHKYEVQGGGAVVCRLNCERGGVVWP